MKKKLCAAMLALLMVGSSVHGQNLVNETQEQILQRSVIQRLVREYTEGEQDESKELCIHCSFNSD